MNRLNVNRIVDYYEDLRLKPHLFIQPVSPEAFFSHAMSLKWGVMLSVDTLIFNDFVCARQHANKLRGWQNRAISPYVEMREKGLDDKQILPELINIEIQMWKILDQWEKENLSKK